MILSIDPGTNKIGVSVLDEVEGRPKLLFSKQIPLMRGQRTEKRLQKLKEVVEECLDLYPDITSISIEQTFVQLYDSNKKNSKDNNKKFNIEAPLKLSMSRGVIYAVAGSKDLLVTEYPAQKVKKLVTGNHLASKRMIINAINKIFSLQLTDKEEDEADSIAIGLTHLSFLKLKRFRG